MALIRIVRPGFPVDPDLFIDLGPDCRGRISNSGGIFGGPIVVPSRQTKSVADSRFAQRDYTSGPYAKPPILEPVNGRPWRDIARCNKPMKGAASGQLCGRRVGHAPGCRTPEAVERDTARRRARSSRG